MRGPQQNVNLQCSANVFCQPRMHRVMAHLRQIFSVFLVFPSEFCPAKKLIFRLLLKGMRNKISIEAYEPEDAGRIRD